MQKKHSFKHFLLKNSYLLITAAWLVTISFIIDNYLSGNASPKSVAKKISAFIAKQENDFDAIAADTFLLSHLAKNTYNEKTLQQLTGKKYFLFVYAKNGLDNFNLLFWNTQVVEPLGSVSVMVGKTGFIQLANGYYVWRKSTFNDLVVVALIPVKWNYTITNDYLKNSFTTGENIENTYSITSEERGSAIKSKEGNFLFSLELKSVNIVAHHNLVASVLRMIAAFFVLIFIHFIATWFVHKNFYKGATFLALAVTALRVASYYFPIPVNFRQFELFDPAVYGSNIILRSLGDLLVNAMLFLWMVLFIRFYIQEKKVIITVKQPAVKWLIVVTGLGLLIWCTFLCGHIFRSMVADSKISFDVINFYTLTVYSVMGFVVFGCIAIGYFFISQIIIYLLQPLLPENIMVLVLVVTITGLAVLSFRVNAPDAIFELYLLIWLLVYLLLLNNKHLFLLASEIISSRLIFWLFFFSLSIAFIILVENNNKEIDQRKHYAENLATKADPSSERLMNTVLTDFRSEALAPLFDNFKKDASNKLLKDSLLNYNFTGYLNKYDTRIFTFDSDENPLFNEDSSTFNTLTTILNTQGKPTAIADLYFYDVSYDRFNYISKKDISDSAGKLLGYVFILASPKRYKTDALYPELFLKGYEKSIENSPVYSYAVYNKLKLVSNHNDYAFPLLLTPAQVPKTDFKSVGKNGYYELWYKAGADKVVIISKKDNFFIEAITLFSYLFCAFLFVTSIFWALNAVIRSRLRWRELRRYWQMSIRNQVHSTIIFISLTSFIIVGVATILFFIDRYNNNNREKLSRTIRVMQNEVRNSLAELIVFDDVIKVYDDGYREKLDKTIAKISEVHAVDINLYDLDGTLKASSLPLPYNKGIVSSKMDPVAYYHLNQLKQIQFFKEETIGTLHFLSNYVPVIDEAGREYAYLNIPYFTSQTKLRQEISNFLVAIINLNAFIFLIAGIVAFFITNRITRSFSFISNKMKAVNLDQMNEAIIWNRRDEIGELVKEYNKMVAKLDNSAAALAKSEREGAWREMARQVAHEIKNPLTPMKLSLQYLQRAIDNNTGNVYDLTKSVARTLVEQIDHLSQIAGEFSQFANIGNPRNEVFDLNESLKLLTQLHSIEDNLELTWKPSNGAVMVDADRTHINRLFTNLIQNALQAIPDGTKADIVMEEILSEKTVLITVKDNGSGIPEEIRSKIFIPNFTTKSSGTGLGLAMCKGIVEESKGNIWFKTAMGMGTTFFVELPVVPG
ncbi:MAG: HAMP domain-containing histidine kinase [Ferruginibacter sp.]|nr:HAMP domain-containing histidine kinase [Ferruginibacter sp.]